MINNTSEYMTKMMKNCAKKINLTKLTTTVALALGVLASVCSSAWAAYPITEQQRAIAKQTREKGVPLAELSPNAPDSYTVVRGDTLWGISAKFLKRPWRWPELWGMNLDQIKNPHLIYPGQMLYLEKINGRARLRLGKGSGELGIVKLSPTVRTTDINTAISAIPSGVIEPFLSQPLIIEENGLKTAPRVVAAEEGRVFLGVGDKAYVRGLPAESEAGNLYHAFRPGKALYDPEGDGKTPLGYEAVFLGSLQLEKNGDPATFKIVSIKQEIGVNDRLTLANKVPLINYVPHPPSAPLSARIMSIYGTSDVSNAGPMQVISLNKGKNDNLEIGHVLEIFRDGPEVPDKTTEERTGLFKTGYPMIKLPDERYGSVFVFRVFDKISYALIMHAERPVNVGDKLFTPDTQP